MAFREWNRNKIYKQLKYLTSLPVTAQDETCLNDIANLEELLNLSANKLRIYESPISWQEQLRDDQKDVLQYADFLDDIGKFAVYAPVIQAVPCRQIYEVSDLTPNLILEFLREFFHQFDSEFGVKFDQVYKERFNNLMFSNTRSISYHIASLGYTYINVEKVDTLEDFLDAAHEYTHAIVNMICYRENCENYPFGELISSYMEMIVADYMMECFLDMEKDLNTIRLSRCEKTAIYAENISIADHYFITSENLGDQRTVIAGMQNISGKSKRYFRKLFRTSALEKLNYTIAYMTAIELYFIYKQDPKECIRLLRHLMFVKRNSNYNQDLKDNGIILNTHSDEWVKTLIKQETL